MGQQPEPFDLFAESLAHVLHEQARDLQEPAESVFGSVAAKQTGQVLRDAKAAIRADAAARRLEPNAITRAGAPRRLTTEAAKALGALSAMRGWTADEQETEIIDRVERHMDALLRLVTDTSVWLLLHVDPQEVVDDLVERYGEAGAL